MAKAWYSYTGSGNNDYDQISSYFFLASKPICTTGANLCAVYAVYSGDYPNLISPNLKSYIAAGLARHVPQPDQPAGAKKYVYMKL